MPAKRKLAGSVVSKAVAPAHAVAHAGTSRQASLKLQTTIPARAAAISPLVDSVLQLVHQNGARHEWEIETALREALANAIKHGCNGDPEKVVSCTVEFSTAAGIHIIVRDPGRGFDHHRLPDPTLRDHLLENHGRGIFLISRLMDEVRFRRHGSEIHMRKH